MFHLRAPSSVYLPHGRQPRSDMALTPPLHLVRSRAQRCRHLLLRADTKVPDPALLAQIPQLGRFQLRFWAPLRSRSLRRNRSQFQLECVEELVLQAGEQLTSRGRSGSGEAF